MIELLNESLADLRERMAVWGEPKYRAAQILTGYYRTLDLTKIANIPKALRERLQGECVAPMSILKKLVSSDGTVKYLYRLHDGNVIEGVLMRYHHGNTLCVSTQVGCRMGCVFCASTIGGLVRNLSAGEILGQVLAVNLDEGGGLGEDRAVTNIVMMGSGEPLDNYENVVRFLRLVNAPEGIGVSLRNVSLSTCGIVPKIRELADSGLGVTLSISLHAADNETRKKLMPVTNRYPLAEVLDAARYYYEKTGRRVIFEYSVINGVNCDHAKRLADAVGGFPSHVNLILLNPVKERELRAPGKKEAYRFLGELERLGVSVSLRRQIGADIEGACGQLRRNYLENKSDF